MVGIDIENIDRFKEFKKTHLTKIYTKKEIEYAYNYSEPYSHLAGMWCVKEAFIKAIKNKEIPLEKIEILHDKNNAPYINISEELEEYFIEENCSYVDVSISHTDNTAIGIVQII